MQRGYIIVDPGLASPEHGLDKDTQVRCLSYLMSRLSELCPIPEGVAFELIPVQYLGGPFPCIGLYEQNGTTALVGIRDGFEIERRLKAYILEQGVPHLIEVSAAAPTTWKQTLGPHEEALRRCQFQPE